MLSIFDLICLIELAPRMIPSPFSSEKWYYAHRSAASIVVIPRARAVSSNCLNASCNDSWL